MTDPISSDAKSDSPKPGADRVVIKKYANRRLYNTSSSSYVTLEHLSEMVKKHVDFVVFDAKTNDDITRSVLTQIIFDEENRGQNLLPIQFLRQLIRFYGDSMQALVPSYLELSLDSFTQQQERMRTQLTETLGAGQGLKYFDEQIRQNMQLFDRAMKMFTPFAFPRPDESAAKSPASPASPAPTPAAAGKAEEGESLAELKKRLEEMQQQIEKLASKS
jgi:polyhydroxyalkanoate synthesis repressor PhaR